MARLNLSFTHDGSIDITHPRTGWEAVKRIARYLWGIGNGANTNSSVVAQDGVSAASGTLTLASVLAGTVVRVNNVPFTAVSSGATGDQFNVGGTNAEDATSLAAAITASATAGVSGVVTASASDNVVTVTAQDSGLHGNAITLSVDGTDASGTITLAAVTAGTVVRVNGTAFTAVSGAAGANEFDIDGTDAQDATALAAAITAAIPTIATAAAADEVVTVTAATEGAAGNAVTIAVDDVAATGTITLASVTAGTIIRINGVAFTAVSGAAGEGEFDIDGDDTADAVELRDAINEHTNAAISGVVTATSNLGVVTVTAVTAGKTGNAITIAVDAVAATGSFVLTSVAAGTVVRVNGVPFTAVNGLPVVANGEFDISSTDDAAATSLAAAINGSGNAAISGVVTASADTATVTVTAVTAGKAGNAVTLETDGVVASGTVTYSSATGTLTTTINGVNVTASAGVDDTASAVAMAAAINAEADALVAGHVRATSDGAEVQIYAIRPGEEGNAITLASAATGGSATASGARLAGGVVTEGEGARATGGITIDNTADGNPYVATINGVDITLGAGAPGDGAATAAALVELIQTSVDALVQRQVYATVASNVITVDAQRGGTGGNAITLAASGTGATASGARLTGGAPATTVVPSGARLSGGTTPATVSFSAARLSGGSTPATVTFSGARLTGGAANSTVTLSGARLTGGAVTTEKTYAL